VKPVQLDINDPVFQERWFSLPGEEALRVMQMLGKIRRLTWDQLYTDRGLRWEAIRSRVGPDGQRLYSVRATQKMRAVGYRSGNTLRLISLHPDHDSAHQ
jgi:hypothetical protein